MEVVQTISLVACVLLGLLLFAGLSLFLIWYFFGESEKERGDRVYWEYVAWQRAREEKTD